MIKTLPPYNWVGLGFGLVLLSLWLCAHASAQDFAVAPSHIHLDPDHRTQTVRITNRSENGLEFRFDWVHFTMDETGQRREVALPDDPITDHIRIGPRALRLPPGETGIIRLFINPQDIKAQYRGHLLITSHTLDHAQTSEQSDAQIGIRFKFVLSVVINPDTELSQVDIINPTYLDTQSLRFDLQRTTPRAVWGHIVVNDTDGVIGQMQGVGVYETTPLRHVTIPLSRPATSPLTLRYMTPDDVVLGEAVIPPPEDLEP